MLSIPAGGTGKCDSVSLKPAELHSEFQEGEEHVMQRPYLLVTLLLL